MKKEKIAFFLMLVSIIFSACSNKEDIENSA